MFINYGAFEPYTPSWPDSLPSEHALRSFKYYRNAAGDDFYALTHPVMTPELAEVLGPAPILVSPATYIAAAQVGSAHIVQVAGNDPSLASPPGMTFCAVDELPDPSVVLGKVIDLATGVLTDRVIPPRPVIISKADIWRRATDAEAEAIDAYLEAQPVRIRNLFRDAEYLSSDDALFPNLVDAFVSAFGEARAAELLAPSSP